MKRLFPIIMITAFGCSNPQSNLKEAWDGPNDPAIFQAGVLDYQTLKQDNFLEGSLAKTPWSDTYWPLTQVGFAARWIDYDRAEPFTLTSDVESSDYAQTVRQEIQEQLALAENLWDSSWQENLVLSPAEKYDIGVGNDMDLTKNELSVFGNNRRAYKDIDWNWMGHCHGWAPASYLFKAPEHGVLMKNSSTEKEVLFTPGDVRGLLTKAGSDNPFTNPVKFMGTRCDDASATIPRDSLNRIVDGALGTWNSGSSQMSNLKPIKIIHNNWFNYDELNRRSAEVVFQFGPNFSESKTYWLKGIAWNDERNKVVDVEIYSTKILDGELVKDMVISSANPENIGRFVDASENWLEDDSGFIVDLEAAQREWLEIAADIVDGPSDAGDFLSFKYYKECRDLNAGAFHSVIAQQLSDGGTLAQGIEAQSFVMDITRDDQVWNHAIYKFKSVMGEPTPLELEENGEHFADPYRKWRAPTTTKIVDVYTQVEYAVENGPKLVYAPEDEATHSKLFHYTLELNDEGKVVGGEWHGKVADGYDREDSPDYLAFAVPQSGANLYRNMRAMISSQGSYAAVDSPDFIWTYPEGTYVEDGEIIKADFVKKVHDCSLDSDLEQNSIDINGVQIPYVKCEY